MANSHVSRIEIKCDQCGKHRKISPWSFNRCKHHFCNRICWRIFNKNNPPISRPDGHKTKDHRGYVFVKMSQHPHKNANGKVAEHRLVMEKMIGRFLLPNEFVHHQNGIKNDNRPENLKYFKTARQHFDYLQGRLQYLEKCIEDGKLVWNL